MLPKDVHREAAEDRKDVPTTHEREEIPASKRARDIRAAIAVTVRRLREERGYSQEALAEACLVSRSLISRIEQGRNEPRLSTLLAVVDALEVTPAQLFEMLGPALQVRMGPGMRPGLHVVS